MLPAVLLVVLSCQQTDCCVFPEEAEGDLLNGKYRVYEYGYSPGAGYVTEKVPENPPQLLHFQIENKFSSNFQGLEQFRYFLIVDDTLSDSKVLALYKRSPNETGKSQNYTIKVQGDELQLFYRFCREGCHIGLRKME